MGFVGDLFNSDNGVGYKAQGANLDRPVDTIDTDRARARAREGLVMQKAFVDQLMAQGGIGNQSSVFNQQQALASQLQDQANGIGPNPVMAQLANTTGQNVNQQAALMGSQRGVGANAGMLARQSAMQGGAIQQNSAGQAAVLQAQQQLAARQQLQQQQAMMGGLAGQQVAQQGQGMGNYNQLLQTQQQNLLNAIAQRNAASVGMQSNINNANASIANTNAQGQQAIFGGFMSGLSGAGASSMGGGGGGGMGSAMGSGGGGAAAAGAKGGMVKGYADGGQIGDNPQIQMPEMGAEFTAPPPPPSLGVNTNLSSPNGPMSGDQSGPMSFVGKFLQNSMYGAGQNMTGGTIGQPATAQSTYVDPNANQGQIGSGIGAGTAAMKKGGYDQGHLIKELATMGFGASGGKVKGSAQVDGDSLKNDKVPAMLSPGEIVIPRSVAQSEDAPDKSKAFVEAVLSKSRNKRK